MWLPFLQGGLSPFRGREAARTALVGVSSRDEETIGKEICVTRGDQGVIKSR